MADITGVTAAEIKNQALFLLGFPNEIDFTVLTNPTVMKVNRIYDTTLLNVLSDYRWRFTIKRVELGQSVTESYGINTATDIITTSSISFRDGQALTLSAGTVGATPGTIQSGLSGSVTYYTVNSSGFTCQMARTIGGVAIDLTSSGSGAQYVTYTERVDSGDTYKYKYVFTLPSDMLTFNNAFYDSGYNTAIRQFETNQTYLNTDSTTAYLAYNALVDETAFPQYFINYYRYKLAMDLCFNLTGDTDLLQILALQAKEAFIKAKKTDALQVATKTIKSNPIVAVRY